MSVKDESVPQGQDEDISYDLLQCLEQGKCGELQYINDTSVKVDLAQDVPLENAVKFTDSATGDLVLRDVRVLSPGIRNGYTYERDVVSGTRHYKGLRELPTSSSPFMAKHSSDPLKQIGRVESLRYDPTEDAILGNIRIYSDPDLPAAKAAIALINRETGFLSVSTRLKAEPEVSEGKTSVKNLRLIHVAWVDVGADPTAGVSMSNEETLDNLLPISDKDSWDGSGAERRVWEWSGENANKAKAAYFWGADNPQKQGDLKLPFADIVGGTLTAIKGGVQAAYGAMRGSHGNKPSIPSGDMAGVLSKIHSYYTKMGLEWPLDQSESTDTTQLEPESAKDETETTNRGSKMAIDKEPENAAAEPSAKLCGDCNRFQDGGCADGKSPDSCGKAVADQAEVIVPVIDNATPEEVVITMTQQEFDLKLEAALKEHDEMMQAAYRRKEMIGEITKLDNGAKTDFLITLDEAQLAEYKATVERFAQMHEKLVMENADLKRNYPAYPGGEKPTYGGMSNQFGIDMAKVEEVYPSKTPQQLRKEAAMQAFTGRMIGKKDTGDA